MSSDHNPSNCLIIVPRLGSIQKKKAPFRALSPYNCCAYKPNSVSRERRQLFIWDACCQAPLAILPPWADPILHSRKDLAVSPLCFHKITPCGVHCLSAPASLLAPLLLPTTDVTRYASSIKRGMFGLSSFSCKAKSSCPAQQNHYITRFFSVKGYLDFYTKICYYISQSGNTIVSARLYLNILCFGD